MPRGTEGVSVESQVIGKIGNWVFVKINHKGKDKDIRRWAAVLMRPEKMLGKPSKHRKKRLKLLMRRTEVLVDANQESIVAYSHLVSDKKMVGTQMVEPDPIPFIIIHKLMELREEGKSPIITPESKIILPQFDSVKKAKEAASEEQKDG